MGGKDSPTTQYAPSSPQERWRSSKLEQKSSLTYTPKSNSPVNHEIMLDRAPVHKGRRSARSRGVIPDWPLNPVSPPTATSQSQSPVKPEPQHQQQFSPTRSEGTVSPIRLYMECFEPRTITYAIVGDSGVGKTSLLMSYTTGEMSEDHTPTIYDKFSCKC